MRLVITGGAGFIGSAVVRMLVGSRAADVVNVDKLTYAANLASLESIAGSPGYRFVRADICDRAAMSALFNAVEPDLVMHLTAESHVDRSIDGPGAFIETNILGTYTLLDVALTYWSKLSRESQSRFRFLHVSTDEVYGSLGPEGQFTETTPYAPNSPYSSSKAASDHLVRAWHHTYGLPTLITNYSNNYGPCQFPEKLIPLIILNGLEGKKLPVYGAGANVRDWLYVDDHARALWDVAMRGRVGETYNVGGNAERRNIEVVVRICDLLDEAAPAATPRRALIEFVTDRPGHDLRYAIDTTKIAGELGWRPRETFETGLAKTVMWYLANRSWWEAVCSGSYAGERLGLSRRQAIGA